ncbi:unnamed protein product [Linum tenue]|uniref:Cytochrome P450 n=1 Tax=Linum tenue TaxID=586396 RepID=A0AAV0QZG3_9ROSI|nr:unnamed protein product [Linum tenue]
MPPPLQPIPGSYGWPVVGPLRDRLDYFWFQGPDEFFMKRMKKYQPTVFRTNIPPCFPFFDGVNPNVVAVLDCKAFAHMFDVEVADKKDILVGDFVPSAAFTGNVRTCAYLDTFEPNHAQVKRFAMDILKRSSKVWVSELLVSLDEMWSTVESNVSAKGSTNFLLPLQRCLFKFLTKSIVGADVSKSPDIAKSGPIILDAWLALQLLPTVSINVVQPLEEIFLHSFRYPSFLIRRGYNKLADFIGSKGTRKQTNLTRVHIFHEEVVHHLLFILGFNAFGGFSVFLPGLLGRLISDQTLQEQLRVEARKNGNVDLSFDSVKQMPLVQSFVYETLRFKPPVPTQFARARKDFRLSSYDASYDIKKGEVLCGYQPLVMRDPKVFDDPDSFKPDRFVGDKGAELLKYLYWSNGPQVGSTPNEMNKQCPGRDYVTLTASLIVAYLVRRYDSITGDGLTIRTVQKAMTK